MSILEKLYSNMKIILLFWTILIGIMLIIEYLEIESEIEGFALIEANANLNKDIGIRHWASIHGGVYVPVTDYTQPNPLLIDIPERDITSENGLELTLMNPAYMIRQLNEYFENEYGILGHITSEKYTRYENRPDEWEQAALNQFYNGVEELSEITEYENERYLRLMQPITVKESCLKCHGDLGYEVGDIRGGISVSIPLKRIETFVYSRAKNHFFSILFIGLAGYLLLFSYKYVYRLSSRREKDVEDILSRIKLDFSTTMQSIGDGVITTDLNGYIVKVNSVAEKLLGIELSDVISRNIDDIIVKETDDETKVLSTSKGHTFKLNKDNVTKVLTDSTTDIIDSNGLVIGHVVVLRDISEESKLIKQLNHKSKLDAIGQLAGGVVHDFNNMLGAIQGAGEILSLESEKDEKGKTKKYVDIVLKAASQASELTKKLLSFSYNSSIKLNKTSMHSIIKDTQLIAESTIDKSIKIDCFCNAESDIILTTDGAIQNVLLNMIVNSAHAMMQGGLIKIKTSNISIMKDKTLSDGPYIVTEITDNGSGMSSDILERIFEPFFTTREQGKGTGLGLSSSYRIIEDHRGRIDVISEVGKGTEFSVLLPLAEDKVADDKADYLLKQGNENILLVEDELMLAKTTKDYLENLGYSVDIANNGEEGIESILNENSYSLIITDIMMPVMNGFDMYKELKSKFNSLKFLFISGNMSNEIYESIINDGTSVILEKPYRMKELSNIVREIIDK